MEEANHLLYDMEYSPEMTITTQEKIQNAHNRWRRAIEKSAFLAWQKEKYGHPRLAQAFLKYPNGDLNTFLAKWQDYMQSSEYEEYRQNCLVRTGRTTSCGLPGLPPTCSGVQPPVEAACIPTALRDK